MNRDVGDDLPPELASAVDRINTLVKKFEEHPEPAVRDLVFELLSNIDAVHRLGMRRLNHLLKVAGLQRRAVEDPEVRLLFDLYDLGEGGDEARAQAMIESLDPALASMGARMDLVSADAQNIRVRFIPPANAPAEEIAELRDALEQVLLDNLPGVLRADIDVPEVPRVSLNNFVPLSALQMPPKRHWQPVLRLEDLPEGGLRGIEIEGERLLLCHFGGGEVYAYRNACPDTPFPLEAGHVDEGMLSCPWHGCKFDLRGGRRIDAQAPGLGVVPARVEDGVICVSVAQRAVPT